MLVLAYFIKTTPIKIVQPTGNEAFDFFAFLKESFSKTNAGVGLMIMAIGGFVAYMDVIGASDILVHIAMKPLKVFKRNPHLAASMVIPISQVLFIAIPSAAGLSLLLMGSLFKILVRLGVSRVAAVSVITASTAFGIGPACATTASSIGILKIDAAQYFIQSQIPLVWPLSLTMMVAYYFVNRYFDKGFISDEVTEPTTDPTQKHAPVIYALLPILPIALLLIFSNFIQSTASPIQLDTTTVMFLSLFLALVFELVRYRSVKRVFDSLQVFWNGMGDIFKTVITLIIAAEIFAQGLIGLGLIDGLLFGAEALGFGTSGIGVSLSIMIFLSALLMGSGNAAFFSFGPLVPNIAEKIGVGTAHLLLPMQLSATLGRTISPVSGAIVAAAGLAKVDTIAVVKRNLIPVLAALLLMLILHFIL